jgi:hypothetical protein
MSHDPKLARRFSRRTPHARCRRPDCPFTRNGPADLLEAEAQAHMLESGHRVEIIESTSAIYETRETA